MTTMTSEVMTLPQVRLRANIAGHLRAGETYAYLATRPSPAGTNGCLILPADHRSGWPINERSTAYAALAPYAGLKGWWVSADQVEVLDQRVPVTVTPVPEPDHPDLPVQRRSEVPDGAYWARLTERIDGLGRAGDVTLAVDHEGRTLLLFWPEHPLWQGAAHHRPGLPEGWRGWWSRGQHERVANWMPEPTEPPTPDSTAIVVGSRVRVLRDRDVPANAGREATVLDISPGMTDPYRVRYDDGSPGGEHGWWVQEVELTSPFAEGVRVLLTSPHVTTPGGEVFAEHRRPVGFATGVLGGPVGRPGASPGTWFITWDNGGHRSVVNESCLTPLPPTDEFAVGDEVILVSDHVITPGGHVFHEAPEGIGSRGRIDSVGIDGRRGIRWLNDDGSEARHSTIHTSCLAHYPTLPAAEETTDEVAETRVVGYEGVPEEHWAAVPEGVHKIRHPHGGIEEWMAMPRERGGWMAIAWPGHPAANEVAMVRANHPNRPEVPADWFSWAVVAGQGVDLGPWPTVEPTAEPTAEPTDEVARLRAELAEVQRHYDEDISRIAEIMKDEADRREWCGEYEEVVERINRRTHATFAAERPVTYEVHFSGMVPFSGTYRLDLPRDPSEAQVREALVQAFTDNASALVSYATADWREVDTSDLSVDEYDED